MKNQLKKNIVIIILLLFLFLSVDQINKVFAAGNYIYYGSPASKVKQIQRRLKDWGYYDGNVDGNFGWRTEEGVKYFQKKHGITQDGKCGKITLEKLGLSHLLSSSGSASSSSGESNNSDVILLAKCIYGEARGEPYEGQVAVGAVILNRVNSSDFPNTISGVIYQSGAFDAVSDGQINLTPNESCIKAARDAISGWDPTGGAIYYYNPTTATNKWIRSRPIIITIGKHVFCK